MSPGTVGAGLASAARRESGGGGIRTHERLATPTVFETAPFNHSGTPPGLSQGLILRRAARKRAVARLRGSRLAECADGAGVQGSEQTRIGRFFDRHPLLLRALAIGALLWGVGYLTWRIGWSGEGASPVAFAMLLVTEIYGLWALGTLAWFSWSRPARGAAAGDAGAHGRRLRLHLRRADRGGGGDAGRLPRPHLPAHDLPARRRPAAGDGGAGASWPAPAT